MKRTIVLFLCFFLCCSLASFSQSTQDSTYRVVTRDGNEYFGKIVSRDADGIQLRSEKLGDIRIKTEDIKTIAPIDPRRMTNGQYWNINPQSSRYFWAPNGYGLRKGEGYYQNVWIFFNQVAYGITNNFSIGAGVVPLFLFAGESTPVWITPKVSFPVVKDKFNIGAGALVGTVIGESESGFGLLYGSGTLGSRDRNITIGLGWGYSAGEIASKPTINFSGMYRVSRRWYLLTENYYINGGEDGLGILSFGARYASRNIGVDFGLFVPVDEGSDFIAVPWLGIVVPFGKR